MAMEIIRRNTDYAIRAVVCLAERYGKGPVTTAQIARQQEISYQLACKLLQRLQKAGLVTSQMGARGGFLLAREPRAIGLLEVIEAVQGRLTLNKCLGMPDACGRKGRCPVSSRLAQIEQTLRGYLEQISIRDVLQGDHHETTG